MEVRKIARGKEISEVRGSLNHTLRSVERAFRVQFEEWLNQDWGRWVHEVFEDYVIVFCRCLPIESFWKVGFEAEDDTFVFVETEDWEVVELAYKARPLAERLLREEKDQATRFAELSGTVELVESDGASPDGPWAIRGIGITADKVTSNGTLYKRRILAEAVAIVQDHLGESAGQGRVQQLLGEVEHPSMKPTRRPFLNEVVVNWEECLFDGKQVTVEGKLLGTQAGHDLRAQMKGGVKPGISQRGYGTSVSEEQKSGEVIEVVEALIITGYDLVLEPSDTQAAVTYAESQTSQEEGIAAMPPKKGQEQTPKEPEAPEGAVPVTELTTAEIAAQRPDLVESIVAQSDRERELARMEAEREIEEEQADRQRIIDEAQASLRKQLDLGETDSLENALQEQAERLAQLETESSAREVAEYVESEIKGIANYPEWVRTQVQEEVMAGEPKSIDEAKTLIKARRSFADQMLSQLKRQAMGDPTVIEVLGPVIEGVTGAPAFTKPAMLLVESCVRHGYFEDRSKEDASNPLNSRFAQQYMAAFDQRYKHHLVQEARLFEEAEQVSDLNLPYTVMRAIVAEAVPDLVATSIFDVQMTSDADTRVYYEAYAGETGETVAVTDETVTSAEGDWFDLANQAIVPGTWVLEPGGGGTPFVEGDDYVVDARNGKLWTITAANGGTIGDSTDLDLDYSYRAIRKGELGEIERGKGTLDFVLLSMAADRLAMQISREAVVLSRAALGYDATARTIAMMTRRCQRYVDAQLIDMAIAAALQVPANAGLAWDSSSETIDVLIERLGTAKVRIINRYYDPTFILMSATQAEVASNWDNFTAAGTRADAMLNANGFIGRIKGLPLIQSTEMRDGYAVVGNREIVHHRVLQPWQLFGPYGTTANAKLVAAEQYYVEEFNGSDSPVPEKAAHVVLS